MIVAAAFHIICILAIGFFWWRKEQDLQRPFVFAFAGRLICALLLGLLYKYYYTAGDTFGFFHDAVTLSKIAHRDFNAYVSFMWSGNEMSPLAGELLLQQPRSIFLTKLVSILNLLTLDNYWIDALYFALASFAAAMFLLKQIIRYFPELRLASIIALLFLPSVLFWGSGVIKDSLSLAGLCVTGGVFLRLWHRDKVRIHEYVLLFIAVWMMWNLKYYLAATCVSVIVTSLVVRLAVIPLLKPRKIWIEFAIWFVIYLFPLAVISQLRLNFSPDVFLGVISENYAAFLRLSEPGDMIHFSNLEKSGAHVLENVPLALFSGLFRPFIWEATTLFQFLMALENLLLLVLFAASLWNIRQAVTSPHRMLILTVVVYVIILCTFLTLSSPNFGTLSRYRIGYLPFFALLLMIKNPLVERVERFVRRLVP